MPGLSFLSKKRWHPSRLDNQKRLFIKEQAVTDSVERNATAAKEVQREQEILLLTKLNGQENTVDARTNELKFMYCQPVDKKKEDKSNSTQVDGDDEMTRMFKEKLLNRITKRDSVHISIPEMNTQSNSDSILLHAPIAPIGSTDDKYKERELHRKNKTGRFDPNYGAGAVQSNLEQEVGRKHKGGGMSQKELEEKYPQLKNAPTEGNYANNIQVRHKPFNAVIRYVQCRRCGVWGHASGDRECALQSYNPQDTDRLRREDPMTGYLSKDLTALEEDKQRLIHAHTASRHNPLNCLPGGTGGNGIAMRQQNKIINIGGSTVSYDLLDSEEEDHHDGGENDEEGREDAHIVNIGEELLLLASLTDREKKRLIQKLQVWNCLCNDLYLLIYVGTDRGYMNIIQIL